MKNEFLFATHTKNGTPVQNIVSWKEGYKGEIRVKPKPTNPWDFGSWTNARWNSKGQNLNDYLSPHEDLVLPEDNNPIAD